MVFHLPDFGFCPAIWKARQLQIHANPALESQLSQNKIMSGIQFVTDEKGRKVGVLIDLKKHGAIWEDFWDGFVSESRRK